MGNKIVENLHRYSFSPELRNSANQKLPCARSSPTENASWAKVCILKEHFPDPCQRLDSERRLCERLTPHLCNKNRLFSQIILHPFTKELDMEDIDPNYDLHSKSYCSASGPQTAVYSSFIPFLCGRKGYISTIDRLTSTFKTKIKYQRVDNILIL